MGRASNLFPSITDVQNDSLHTVASLFIFTLSFFIFFPSVTVFLSDFIILKRKIKTSKTLKGTKQSSICQTKKYVIPPFELVKNNSIFSTVQITLNSEFLEALSSIFFFISQLF